MVLLVGALTSCFGPTTNVPVHPVTDTDQCGLAEKNLLALECKDRRGRLLGGPNLHGESYKARCEALQLQQNVWINPKCKAEAKTCEEAAACP